MFLPIRPNPINPMPVGMMIDLPSSHGGLAGPPAALVRLEN